MSRLKKADIEKIKVLEQSVINDSAEEVANVYKSLGEVAFTAHILGIACRFRNTDVVKALVENGASFAYDVETVKYKYFDLFGCYYPGEADDFTHIMLKPSMAAECSYVLSYMKWLRDKDRNPLQPVSDKEFIKTITYLCENTEKTAFNPGDFLYYMILSDEEEIVRAMRDIGVTLSDAKITLLTEGVRDGEPNNWYTYCFFTRQLHDKDFKRIMSELAAEIGSDKKLYFTEYLYDMNEKRFFNSEFFGFFLEHFNQSKMNKTKLLREIILRDDAVCLDTAAQNGWLKNPRKRDEMIQYAADNKKTECAAFLLDFKNRTADLAAEEKREEKKLMRELNSSPNSVLMLKKLWNFKKREDGTLVITGYKGSQTDITVPERIGRSKVTVIGSYAFSPTGYKLTDEAQRQRRLINQITLPEGITEIENYAFEDCVSLQSVNIHDGLLRIGAFAFFRCMALKNIILPPSLKTIDTSSFDESPNVTAIVQKGSYAEGYCKDKELKFTYKDFMRRT